MVQAAFIEATGGFGGQSEQVSLDDISVLWTEQNPNLGLVTRFKTVSGMLYTATPRFEAADTLKASGLPFLLANRSDDAGDAQYINANHATLVPSDEDSDLAALHMQGLEHDGDPLFFPLDRKGVPMTGSEYTQELKLHGM